MKKHKKANYTSDHQPIRSIKLYENKQRGSLECAGFWIFENEDKIVLGSLVHQVFKPRGGSAEPWYRIKKGESLVLTFKNGSVNLYHREPGRFAKRGWKKWQPDKIVNCTPSPKYLAGGLILSAGSRNKDTLKLYQECVISRLTALELPCNIDPDRELEFSEIVISAAYPVLGEIIRDHELVPPQIPGCLSPILRGKNAREISDKAFGKKSSPALARLLKESLMGFMDKEAYLGNLINLDNLLLAWIARTWLTRDHLQQIMSWRKRPTRAIVEGFDRIDNETIRSVRKFLARFEAPRIMRFLREVYEEGNDGWINLKDSARILERHEDEIPMPPRIRSLKELHDHLAREESRLRTDNFPIPVHPLVAQFEGHEIGGMTVHFPTSSHELVDWGSAMRNCIAGYAEEARRGECQLMSLFRDGKMVYNIMLDPRGERIEQFYGPCNAPADGIDEAVVSAWIRKNKDLWKGIKAHKKGWKPTKDQQPTIEVPVRIEAELPWGAQARPYEPPQLPRPMQAGDRLIDDVFGDWALADA